jgi:hypothetical protein
MNRSILIVICDFLLVSLLAFSTVDINQLSNPAGQRTLKLDLSSTNRVENGGSKDLEAAMQVALGEERKQRDQLLGELTRARQAAGASEQQVQSVQQQLREHDQQAYLLQQQEAALQQQYAAAQTNLQLLSRQLEGNATEAALSREILEQMKSDLRKQSDRSAALQKELDELSRSNEMVQAEKERLATQLRAAQGDERLAARQIADLSQEVQAERAEKAKLAAGIEALATNSSRLAQEIHENTRLAPNAIFSDFVSNRVEARFAAAKAGFFGGESVKQRDAHTLLMSDGTHYFALCHVDDTPLALELPGTDWLGITGSLEHGGAQFQIRSLSFAWPDPRLALIPVTAEEAHRLGCRIYRTTAAPYKFQDAVLVGAQADYYGECRFEIDLSEPDYVKLDRNLLKGLFGKFNPSRGDLVFSENGELLGLMANNDYCFLIHGFSASASLQFGQDLRDQHTGHLLARLYEQVTQMPFKLQ